MQLRGGITMNVSLIILIAIVFVVIITPVIIKTYSDHDYKKQVDGSRKERRFSGENPPVDVKDITPSTEQLEADVYKEQMKAELKLKGGQNILGPM